MSETTGEYQKARAVKEFYAARLAKLTFDDREAGLVSSDEIDVAHFKRTRLLRERLFAVSSQLDDQIAEENDVRRRDARPRAVEDILEVAIRDALVELSGIMQD